MLKYIYELPNVFRNKMLDGWSLNGLITLQSGSPFSAIGNATRNAFWAQVSRVRLDLVKNFAFRERLGTAFRWELFNAFNQATFANPASTFAANGPDTADRITSTIGGPRTMQAALPFVSAITRSSRSYPRRCRRAEAVNGSRGFSRLRDRSIDRQCQLNFWTSCPEPPGGALADALCQSFISYLFAPGAISRLIIHL